MALCIEVSGSTLSAVGEFTEACQGYALMSATEYANVPTLATLFALPDTEQTQAAFMAGISLPLILWLASWGFGVVVNWFNDRAAQATLEDE